MALSVQEVQVLSTVVAAAGFSSALEHESITRGKSGARKSLLHVFALPLHPGCRKLLQFVAVLPRVRSIETKATPRDPGRLATSQREQLWREFFSNPSQWWNGRHEKTNAKYPDFKHKKTREALWLDDPRNPPWVEAELAALAPGIVQLDKFSWNRRLARYVKAGQPEKTMELFQQMQQEGLSPDKYTFLPVLNACASLRALEAGRHAHEQIVENHCEDNLFVGTSLIDMYTKCGCMEEAWRVFNKMELHDVVSWNAMLMGHVKCGQGQKALQLFEQMHLEGVEPNPVTFVAVLNACAVLEALDEGKRTHGLIVQAGCECDLIVGNSLIDMYAKCGSMEDALRIFNKMCSRDVISWTVLIQGYARSGQGQQALELFQQMQCEGVQPNTVTFLGVLNACATVMALEEGRCTHEQIIECGFESDVFVGSSLIDMYAKCGSMEDAWRVFTKRPSHNVITWTAMLKGYAMHGHGMEALAHFEWMCEEGVPVNNVTFVCLLSACSHAGLVYEGSCYFGSMGSVYDVSVTVEHYACVVDLLGRAGCLQEAIELITTMPFEPSAEVWTALLGACRIHGDVEIGE